MTDEALRATVARIFEASPFIGEVGIAFHDAGVGWCEAGVALAPRHLQHTGVAHAGLIATLADHCGGGAAYTQTRPGEQIVTVEFKLNMLRPGKGERLSCRAQVLKAGRSFHVVESEVFAHQGTARTLVAKLNATWPCSAPDCRRRARWQGPGAHQSAVAVHKFTSTVPAWRAQGP